MPLHAVKEIAENVLQALLMVASITIESFVMIMYKNAGIL